MQRRTVLKTKTYEEKEKHISTLKINEEEKMKRYKNKAKT